MSSKTKTQLIKIIDTPTKTQREVVTHHCAPVDKGFQKCTTTKTVETKMKK